MADYRCRPRQAAAADQARPMEEAQPMKRYISPCAPNESAAGSCESLSLARQNQILLEQLVELSSNQCQLLVDLLGAVNALTAALLTTRAQV
ncbi:conserved hypothetical protein [uncultured Eubacteriales bacterium]|uniref:Uncharacterized protein n=1 Tax=uncultured Eubacteriales bacterium TaxID=172733 RepID=A0A212KF17_9FIRM|nr:conserved hypothetical protein [uncultured Eubacteriales bacterium]